VNIALWVVQGLTALAFGQHGYSMLFQVEQARTRMAWTRAVSIPLLRFIGVAEIVGAIGVIVPAATGVLPWLTVAAAGGLVTVMALAIVFHLIRREWPNIVLNAVLGALAAFVLYGRLALEPT
jgi:hypothetical protein